jgi:hypothetical protein
MVNPAGGSFNVLMQTKVKQDSYQAINNDMASSRPLNNISFKQNTGTNQPGETVKSPAIKNSDPAIMTDATSKLNTLYEKERVIISKLNQLPPGSNEGQILKKQLENLNNAKVSQVQKLAGEFKPGSANFSALNTTAKMLEQQFKLDLIDFHLKGIRELKMDLNQQLSGLSNESSCAKQLQAKQASLSQMEDALRNNKADTSRELKKLNKSVLNHLPDCSKGVREVISTMNSQESKNDKKAVEANNKVQQSINDGLKSLQMSKIDILKNLSTENNNSKPLAALQDKETDLLTAMRKTFDEGSKQDKALESMIGLNTLETERIMMTNTVERINKTIITLEDHAKAVDHGSLAERDIQNRLGLLYNQAENLNNKIREDSKLLSKEKAKLKRNILGSSQEDRKLLADIRGSQLETINEFRINKINGLEKAMDEATLLLKQENNTDINKETLEAHLENLKKSYQAERRILKNDKDEENFWNVLERIPVQSFNNIYQILA